MKLPGFQRSEVAECKLSWVGIDIDPAPLKWRSLWYHKIICAVESKAKEEHFGGALPWGFKRMGCESEVVNIGLFALGMGMSSVPSCSWENSASALVPLGSVTSVYSIL